MTGVYALYQQMTSGNPATIADLRADIGDSVTSLDDSADSLRMATSGTEWDGLGREAMNQKVWATAAMARMAQVRCSQGRIALKSVRAGYVAMKQDADAAIRLWEKVKSVGTDKDVETTRKQTIRTLNQAKSNYAATLTAATAYLPTDDLTDGEKGGIEGNGKTEWEDYLATGGLTETQVAALLKGLGKSVNQAVEDGTLPGPVIADTEITGNDDNYVPQGVGYSRDENLMVQVSYGGTGDSKSLITLTDPDTGEVVNSVELKGNPGHVGSVNVDGDDVWITGNTGAGTSGAVRYSLAQLQHAQLGEPVGPPQDGRPRQSPLVPGGHSYSTIHSEGGKTYLYAGDFWENKLYRYELENGKWVQDTGYAVTTPDEVQGIVVRGDEISFSTSYGQENAAHVITYNRNDLEPTGDAGDLTGASTKIPNMSEGMVDTPYGTAVLHESGANKAGDDNTYLGTDDQWASPFMTMLSPETGNGKSIEMEPASVRQAGRKLAAVEADLDATATRIKRIDLPSSSLGDVPGAGRFARTFNLHMFTAGYWLDQSAIAAGVTVDGLMKAADEHENADGDGKSLLDRITPWDGALPFV